MPKPYSQDLRDRVIDAVERAGMSCRAAARRYEISESVAIKWFERYRRDGSREPVGHGGHRPSTLMPHREFLEAARAQRHAPGTLRSPLVGAGDQAPASVPATPFRDSTLQDDSEDTFLRRMSRYFRG